MEKLVGLKESMMGREKYSQGQRTMLDVPDNLNLFPWSFLPIALQRTMLDVPDYQSVLHNLNLFPRSFLPIALPSDFFNYFVMYYFNEYLHM